MVGERGMTLRVFYIFDNNFKNNIFLKNYIIERYIFNLLIIKSINYENIELFFFFV